MDRRCEEFLYDYLNMNFEDFKFKYGSYESKRPLIEDFFNYLKATNQFHHLIDTDENFQKNKGIFLTELEKNKKYELYVLFRGMKINEKQFLNLNQAAREKIRRIIMSLQSLIR